jgi:hypothetical protein
VRHEFRRVDVAPRRHPLGAALAVPIFMDRADCGMTAIEKVRWVRIRHPPYPGRMAKMTAARYRARSAMRMGRPACTTTLQGLKPMR